jgi:transcriptional regulator with XRE-family HTH domain
MVQFSEPCQRYLVRKMGIPERLKEERLRLKMTQPEFGALGDAGKTTVISWERGDATPNAAFLSAAALNGLDVQYVVTGSRRGDGLGESAVHQAVLDAVDLLSLGKKVDAQQLAKAVVKLCQRSAPEAGADRPRYTVQQNIQGGVGQQVNGDLINHGSVTNNLKK